MRIGLGLRWVIVANVPGTCDVPGTFVVVACEFQCASLFVKIDVFPTEGFSLENDVILEVNRLGEIFGTHVKLALS